MIFNFLSLCDGVENGVIQNSEQGVQIDEHTNSGAQKQASPVTQDEIIALLDQVNWDDLNVVREVAKHRSLRAASAALKISINTVRGRIERLETAIQTTIFKRNKGGVVITAEGHTVLDIAEKMRSLSAQLPRGEGNRVLVRDGEIRICASEGIGTFWLTPRLLELKKLLPDLVVSLDSFSDQHRVASEIYDITVGFVRPTEQSAIISRIGTVHMMPFASEAYVSQHGAPLNFDEVVGHQCIQQDAPGLNYDALRFFLGEERLKDVVSLRVGSSYSLFWAIASGFGIGALPTYIRSISKRVIPIDLPIQLKFDLWMTYSAASRRSDPIRIAANWLRSSFDPIEYPWFSEKFIHPDSFSAQTDCEATRVVPIFDHLIDDWK
jgi:DNA-binding transcriptional LysR family regulator